MIPALSYDTYDIYIHVRKSPYFSNVSQELEFEFTVVDRDYTIYFTVVRYICCSVAIVVYLVYIILLIK